MISTLTPASMFIGARINERILAASVQPRLSIHNLRRAASALVSRAVASTDAYPLSAVLIRPKSTRKHTEVNGVTTASTIKGLVRGVPSSPRSLVKVAEASFKQEAEASIGRVSDVKLVHPPAAVPIAKSKIVFITTSAQQVATTALDVFVFVLGGLIGDTLKTDGMERPNAVILAVVPLRNKGGLAVVTTAPINTAGGGRQT